MLEKTDVLKQRTITEMFRLKPVTKFSPLKSNNEDELSEEVTEQVSDFSILILKTTHSYDYPFCCRLWVICASSNFMPNKNVQQTDDLTLIERKSRLYSFESKKFLLIKT